INWQGTCRDQRDMTAQVEHGLSQKAVEIAAPFGFPVTNSMVVTWIVALALVLRHDLHLHPVHQLGGADSRGRHDWMGPCDPRGLPHRTAVLPWRQCRRQPHAGNGPDL